MPTHAHIVEQMQKLARYPGIEGCALLEAATGMAWHVVGKHDEMEQLGEAAIEFWRIEARLSAPLHRLGTLRSVAYSFSNKVVALFPCCDEPSLILVCLLGKGNMYWTQWGPTIQALQSAIATVLARKTEAYIAQVALPDSTAQK